MSDTESSASVYELLGNSERIINGSVSLDWRKLPRDLVDSLPDRPKSAEKFVKSKHKPTCSKYRSVGESPKKAVLDEAVVQPLTFNNCHFHYDGQKELELIEAESNGESLKNVQLPDLGKVLNHIRAASNTKKMSLSEFAGPNIDLTHEQDESFTSFRPKESSPARSIRPFDPSAADFGASRSKVIPSGKELSLKREKEMMKTVHEELSSLSQDLKARHKKLTADTLKLEKAKEALAARESELEKRERSLKRDLNQLLQKSVEEREKKAAEDVKLIVNKYDEIVEQLNRENKRLQQSLKDMVQTNRILREQVKSCNSTCDTKDAKIEELTAQLKQAKERAERIKSTFSNSAPAASQKDDQLFLQMKKIISSHQPKPLMADATTQSNIEQIVERVHTPVEKPQQLIRFIYYLLGTMFLESVEDHFFKSIVSSFDYMEESCYITNTTIPSLKKLQQQTNQYYLRLIFGKMASLPPYEQHALASLVYNSLSKLKLEETLEIQKSDDAVLLYHLIPLQCISQSQVIEALLESLLSFLSVSTNSRSSLITFGFGIFLKLLLRLPLDGQISILASSLLLMLVTDGIRLLTSDSFFQKCEKHKDSLTKIIGMDHPLKTLENLSVILSKSSKHSRFIYDAELIKAIEALHSRHLSEFCDLNLKSVLNAQ